MRVIRTTLPCKNNQFAAKTIAEYFRDHTSKSRFQYFFQKKNKQFYDRISIKNSKNTARVYTKKRADTPLYCRQSTIKQGGKKRHSLLAIRSLKSTWLRQTKSKKRIYFNSINLFNSILKKPLNVTKWSNHIICNSRYPKVNNKDWKLWKLKRRARVALLRIERQPSILTDNELVISWAPKKMRDRPALDLPVSIFKTKQTFIPAKLETPKVELHADKLSLGWYAQRLGALFWKQLSEVGKAKMRREVPPPIILRLQSLRQMVKQKVIEDTRNKPLWVRRMLFSIYQYYLRPQKRSRSGNGWYATQQILWKIRLGAHKFNSAYKRKSLKRRYPETSLNYSQYQVKLSNKKTLKQKKFTEENLVKQLLKNRQLIYFIHHYVWKQQWEDIYSVSRLYRRRFATKRSLIVIDEGKLHRATRDRVIYIRAHLLSKRLLWQKQHPRLKKSKQKGRTALHILVPNNYILNNSNNFLITYLELSINYYEYDPIDWWLWDAEDFNTDKENRFDLLQEESCKSQLFANKKHTIAYLWPIDSELYEHSIELNKCVENRYIKQLESTNFNQQLIAETRRRERNVKLNTPQQLTEIFKKEGWDAYQKTLYPKKWKRKHKKLKEESLKSFSYRNTTESSTEYSKLVAQTKIGLKNEISTVWALRDANSNAFVILKGNRKVKTKRRWSAARRLAFEKKKLEKQQELLNKK